MNQTSPEFTAASETQTNRDRERNRERKREREKEFCVKINDVSKKGDLKKCQK